MGEFKQLVDLKDFHEFDPIKKVKSTDELIEFFKFNEDYYKDRNLFYVFHHVTPFILGGSNEKRNLIIVPHIYHVVAHYLLGKEAELRNDLNTADVNYQFLRVNRCIISNTAEDFVNQMYAKAEIIQEDFSKNPIIAMMVNMRNQYRS